MGKPAPAPRQNEDEHVWLIAKRVYLLIFEEKIREIKMVKL